MKTYLGNQIVDPGIYFNRAQWSFRSMAEEGALPGTATDEYVSVPTVALMLLGPILGLAYVIFLPFAGFVMVGNLLAKAVWQTVAETADATARVLRPAWQPAHAFFTNSRQKKQARKTGKDAWAEKAAKEIEDTPQTPENKA